MISSLPQLLFILGGAGIFVHFMTFGARTFVIISHLDSGAGLGLVQLDGGRGKSG
jgi:hypothetical protein